MGSYSDLGVVILAAGNSSRMGTSKQLLEVNGKTLLEHTVSCALHSSIANVTVVLGSNSEMHERVLKGKLLHTIVNPNWSLGIGSTIKFAIKELIARNTNLQALVFLVCDQPRINTTHINKMASFYFLKRPIAIASQYKNTYGVPALFDRAVFASVLSIHDNTGAKEVLSHVEKDLLLIPFEGGEIDLDTPEEYQSFINKI